MRRPGQARPAAPRSRLLLGLEGHGFLRLRGPDVAEAPLFVPLDALGLGLRLSILHGTRRFSLPIRLLREKNKVKRTRARRSQT